MALSRVLHGVLSFPDGNGTGTNGNGNTPCRMAVEGKASWGNDATFMAMPCPEY
ncbi:MAG: hypothetical protein ACI4TW_07140 [Prevotella sp.]